MFLMSFRIEEYLTQFGLQGCDVSQAFNDVWLPARHSWPIYRNSEKKDEKVDCINFTPTSVFLMPASSNQVFLNASNCLLTSSFCNLHWLSIAMFLLKFCTNLILSTHAALIKQNQKQCLNLELTRQCNISFLKRPKTNQARPLSL